MKSNFYSREELERIGFKSLGEHVFISKKASIYGAEKIAIGNNVRIDDFCVLSGEIILGDNIHIAVYTALFGGSKGIEMKDFSCLSSRCAVYAKSDDYSGEFLTNPTIPEKYLGVYEGRVTLGKHVLIGTGSTILPNVFIGEGSAVGSMSLVNKDLGEWGIYAGIPCEWKKERSTHLLALEQKFLEDKNG